MTVLGAQQARRAASDAPGRFEPYHPWDRDFFLTYLVLFWFGVVAGFAPDFLQHLQKHRPYPLVVHFHAAAFVGWLLLLTAQVVLIRTQRPDIHRKLGVAGVPLAIAMIILGPMTALIVDRYRLGTPDSDPPFLSVQLFDIVSFAGMAAAALALRAHPSAHKRLILLALLSFIDAGFARWLGDPLTKLLGAGFWPFMVETYFANMILIAGMGGYDLVTRRRLHPAFVIGATWVLANEVMASWLYVSPFWKPIALKMIGH